jgi:hypothetical protein
MMQRSGDPEGGREKQDFMAKCGEARAGRRSEAYIFYNFQLHPTDTVPLSTFVSLDIEDIYANT